MVNVFNSMSKIVIFQKYRTTSGDIIQLIPFVCACYIFESLLFYNHNVTMIPFAMETYQGDLLGGALFTLTHFKALCSTTSIFFIYLFPCIVNDIHIIRALFIVYEHFQTKLYVIGLYIQPEKCNIVAFWHAI